MCDGKGFITYTLCCMGKALAVLMAYNSEINAISVRLYPDKNRKASGCSLTNKVTHKQNTMEEDYFDEEYYEGQPHESCEKCGRTYDDIGYDYQYCKACGWDSENQKWDKPIKPTDADYLAGEADILTGRWW